MWTVFYADTEILFSPLCTKKVRYKVFFSLYKEHPNADPYSFLYTPECIFDSWIKLGPKDVAWQKLVIV